MASAHDIADERPAKDEVGSARQPDGAGPLSDADTLGPRPAAAPKKAWMEWLIGIGGAAYFLVIATTTAGFTRASVFDIIVAIVCAVAAAQTFYSMSAKRRRKP
jgi:hypothetical protein